MDKRILAILFFATNMAVYTHCFAEIVIFKSGKQIKGKIIERTDQYIKIDFHGAPLTYYLDEVASIDVENGESIEKDKIAKTDEKAVSIGNNLYEQASAKLAAIPQDYMPGIINMLKNGWKEDANIIKLINDNSEALGLFKKATLETSDGYIFGRAPDKLGLSSEPPNYLKHTQLFQLLLLEGKLNETMGVHKEAEEDYLSATRFMIHVSQQRYGVMISSMLNSTYLDLVYLYLDESLNVSNNASYRDNLLNNLKKIKDNQDFLESAFREEAQSLKNTARTLEEEVKKGATFEELFQISTADGSDKEQINEYRDKSKELTAMLDGEFFAEFYKQIDGHIDEFIQTAIIAAKENNSQIYEKKIKIFFDSIDKLGKPLNYLLWRLKETVVEGKNTKLIIADTVANFYLTISIGDHSKLIQKYWEFYNRLNSLIGKLAKKDIA